MDIITDRSSRIDTASPHPSWCSLPRCERYALDVRHVSVPTVLNTTEDDVEVSVAVTRDDEPLPGGGCRPSATGVTVQLHHLAGAWAEGLDRADVMLTALEARRLAADLVAFAELAEQAESAQLPGFAQ